MPGSMREKADFSDVLFLEYGVRLTDIFVSWDIFVENLRTNALSA